MRSEEYRQRALESTSETVRACTRCRLAETRTCAVPGEGPSSAAVLLIGEAPGRDEDVMGRPFVGRAGRILDAALAAAGVPRDSVFITNVVKCRPPGNRRPKPDEIAACRGYLRAQIASVQPRILVTLGVTALRALLGPGQELRTSRGKEFRLGASRVVATYHPAGVLYNRRLEDRLRRDLRAVAKSAARPSDARRGGTSGRTPARDRGARRSRRRPR